MRYLTISAVPIFAAALFSPAGANASEPDFEVLRPTVVFYKDFGNAGNPFSDGNSACITIMNERNSSPGSHDYRNAEFRDKPNFGEGCEFDLYVRATGYFEGRFHYQNWVNSKKVCSAGYSGPYTNQQGDQECRRLVPVIKPPVCPNPVIGHPVDVAAAEKVLSVEDLSESDGLGFSRTYRSRPRSDAGYPTRFGHSWYGDHFQFLQINALSAPSLPLSAQIVRPDGTPLVFIKDAETAQWASEKDALCNSLIDAQVVGSPGFRLKLADGSTESFDAVGRLRQVDTRDGGVLLYEYDTESLLTSVRNNKGRSLTFEYNAARQVQKVSDSAGRYVLLNYVDNVLQKVDYGTYFETYGYISLASEPYLTQIRNDQGALISAYSYDGQGRPKTTERAGGIGRYELDYASVAGQVSVVGPLNATTSYAYHVDLGRRVIDQIAQACPGCNAAPRVYEQDLNLNATAEVSGTSKICRAYELTRNLELTRVVGASISYNCATLTGGTFEAKIETDWHPTERLPAERRTRNASNSLIFKTTWSYNARGQALNQTQTDPVTSTVRTTTTTYCEQADITAGTCPLLGLIKSINGPRTDVSDVTTLTYYASDDPHCKSSISFCNYRKGDLWKVTNALSLVTETLKYDGAGRVLSVKDPNGVITDMDYHLRGWLTARKVRGTNSAVETDDAITRIDYWPTGLVKKVTQPDGAFTSYAYDAAHRLTDITDGSANTIHYTLDNAGNKTGEDTKDAQGALKRTLSRVYNQLGQLQTQKDASQNPTGFIYDANGNTDTVTDALSRVTDNDYDPLNRLQRTLQDVGGINAETKFQYDALDNLTKVTDPKGLDTNYVYNGLGDLTQLASPDTGVTTYTYDSGGNRQTQLDASSTTATYSYDVLNRLTGIAYPTTSLNVAYTYDASQAVCASGEIFSKGRLTKLADSSGTTQYCFDRFGNMVRKVQVSNGKTYTLRYSYTLGGQLSSITYPDNLLVDYVRDGQGRVTQIGVTPLAGLPQVLLTGATYAPFGPVTGWTYGNGRTMQRTFNQDYQPGTINGGPDGLSLGYGFDPVGNLTTLRTHLQTDPPVATYVYDRLNRLSDVKDGPAGTVLEHYGYDATGNRLSVTAAGTTTAYTYPVTNHRLSQVGTVARSYDAIGNTTQIGGTARQFVYNDVGRMSQVKAGATVTMNYLYNGKGEQVRKYLGTANTYTLYDEAGHWLGDYDTAGAPVQQVIWLDDLPVGVLVGAAANQKLHYIEPDPLGTPRVVIDPTPNVAVWKWDLKGEAFGATMPDQNPDGDSNSFVFNMRYPGQRYDAASGLNYNYLRDGYEAQTGRYSQSDPIGLSGGVSTYGYVSGNPLLWSDPTGLARQLDPNGEECRALAIKIENIKRDIEKRRREHAENPNQLPEYFPGAKPRETRSGHLGLISELERILAQRQSEYAAKCQGKAECPEEQPQRIEIPEMTPGAKAATWGALLGTFMLWMLTPG